MRGTCHRPCRRRRSGPGSYQITRREGATRAADSDRADQRSPTRSVHDAPNPDFTFTHLSLAAPVHFQSR